jgi:HK97 gp10 family phage protein
MAVPMIRMSLFGDKQVMARLKGIAPRLRKKALTKAARMAMRPLLQAAKANAPKASGALRKSIKMRAMKRNRRGVVGVYVATGEKFFKGDQFYGGFQEFGWKTGPRRPSKEGSKFIEPGRPGALRINQESLKRYRNRRQVLGRHFIERAYTQGREGASDTFVTELGNQLDYIAKGG